MPNTNSINLAELERIAREQCLPAIENQISTEPSPLFEKIQKPKLTSSIIEVTTGVGMNGGFGYGAETKSIPGSGGQMYDNFKLASADIYGTIEISNKALTLGTGDKGVNLLLNEMQGIKDAAVWNIGRGLFGNGKGILCNVSASDGATNTIKVDSTAHLKEGIVVDFYTTGAAVGSVPAHEKVRIVGINRQTKEITVKGNPITVAAGFITIQGSYGREIFGIGAFFDDSITHIYGVEKAKNLWLIPEVYDANKAITDTILSKGVRESRDYKNSKIDMILCGSDAYDAYSDYMKESKTQITKTQDFVGGVSGMSIVASGRNVVVVEETHIASNEMIGVDTTQLLFPKTNMDFIAKDGGIFERVDNSSIYQAVLGCYGNLLCKNPGGIFKITNVV